ncbi:Centromere protein Scm3 [Geosmithia morbida]|uniref:Centromere protein Scm3 n=1 Tax=Geosmithia morbida TaxID=1094350 RepID=A0A9P4YXV6_9HYPO|nr:Centromere protein Scm3 [Geosmithia morbida]KAF4125091.1 Centromere protein Scm3 [Geosmithia morbida]
MEPPAKRARLDEPPYYEHRHVDDVVIDPQLSHGVHEKEGVNGPSLTHEEGGEGDFAGKSEIDLEAEYILEQQRAKAGSRFQQAMASIFDKYSRDFADVGDEIDLATGQVIVDNGHLANMRYEGDLGIDDGTTTDGHDDGDDNDDEGTLLEDWVDDDEDEGVRLEDLPDDWDGPSGAVLGGAIPPSSPEPPAASNPHGGPNQLPFSPADNVSMGLDPDSSSFDAPPLNLRPWGFLGHVDGAEWESLPKPKQKTRPQPQPQPRLNMELKTKPKPKPRIASGTTVYRGGKSIWDPDPGTSSSLRTADHPSGKSTPRSAPERRINYGDRTCAHGHAKASAFR